ncbi:hypothetical protein ACFE04_010588 [Oxalis oulophora]
MGFVQSYGPEMAMIGIQFSSSVVALFCRAALIQGMNPRVFIVYRQATATLVIAPIAFFTRNKSSSCKIGLRSFSLIFLASLIGVTLNQNAYFEGLYLSSSSLASAMFNLVPAVTFIMAASVGLEKINIRSLRSNAKILGTVLCVTGAVAMVLLRGPKLLNSEFQTVAAQSLFGLGRENWFLGCLFLFASVCCWSLWLILQVPVSKSYPDHLSLSAWMCFLATLQSTTFALFLEKDPGAWYLNSKIEIFSVVFAGIFGSGLQFFGQAWCISLRGPLFSAMFNPLATVIVTILAAIFLHEEIYIGSLIGAVGVVIGLYIVLWGKARDYVRNEIEDEHRCSQKKSTSDLEESLLVP